MMIDNIGHNITNLLVALCFLGVVSAAPEGRQLIINSD